MTKRTFTVAAAVVVSMALAGCQTTKSSGPAKEGDKVTATVGGATSKTAATPPSQGDDFAAAVAAIAGSPGAGVVKVAGGAPAPATAVAMVPTQPPAFPPPAMPGPVYVPASAPPPIVASVAPVMQSQARPGALQPSPLAQALAGQGRHTQPAPLAAAPVYPVQVAQQPQVGLGVVQVSPDLQPMAAAQIVVPVAEAAPPPRKIRRF